MVVVVEGNIIKNTMIDISDNLTDEELLNLNILLNSSLNGLTIEEINLDVISKLKVDADSGCGALSNTLSSLSALPSFTS